VKKVVDAAKGQYLQFTRLLIYLTPEGHYIWLGTQDQYDDARRSAGDCGVHLGYKPLHETAHMYYMHAASIHYM
jgi:hypothetical protein